MGKKSLEQLGIRPVEMGDSKYTALRGKYTAVVQQFLQSGVMFAEITGLEDGDQDRMMHIRTGVAMCIKRQRLSDVVGLMKRGQKLYLWRKDDAK